MGAAAIGEVMACLVRVPTENVKQKMQVGLYKTVKEGVSGKCENKGDVRCVACAYTLTLGLI